MGAPPHFFDWATVFQGYPKYKTVRSLMDRKSGNCYGVAVT
jgi:hypothetical protein